MPAASAQQTGRSSRGWDEARNFCARFMTLPCLLTFWTLYRTVCVEMGRPGMPAGPDYIYIYIVDLEEIQWWMMSKHSALTIRQCKHVNGPPEADRRGNAADLISRNLESINPDHREGEAAKPHPGLKLIHLDTNVVGSGSTSSRVTDTFLNYTIIICVHGELSSKKLKFNLNFQTSP